MGNLYAALRIYICISHMYHTYVPFLSGENPAELLKSGHSPCMSRKGQWDGLQGCSLHTTRPWPGQTQEPMVKHRLKGANRNREHK